MIAAALIDYCEKDYGDNVKRAHIVLGLTVFTLGILSVVPVVCATESPDIGAGNPAIGEPFVSDVSLSLDSPFQTSENFSLGAVTETPGGGFSASELNRELSNPVSSTWSISNQFNNFELNNGHWNNN